MPPSSAPLVTVGLPVYNGAPQVQAAVTALLSQSHGDLCLVISDNASTDETEGICRAFAAADPRVAYFRQPTNIGPWANFAFLLSQAESPFFMWAAHDDHWERDYVGTCLAAHRLRPALGIAFTRFSSVLLCRGAAVQRREFPSLEPILSLEGERRLAAWVLLDEYSQKANLIYGVWRTDLAREVMDRYRASEAMVYKGLDIIMLTYALARAPASQADEVLFTKQYTDYLVGSASSLLRPVRSFLRRPLGTVRRAAEFSRDHCRGLEEALSMAGVLTPAVRRAIRLKRIIYFLPVYRYLTSQRAVTGCLRMRGWSPPGKESQ